MASDLIILAVMAKFLLDLAKDRLIPEWLFYFGGVGMAFLLGFSGGSGNKVNKESLSGKKVLKEGLSLAAIAIFTIICLYQGILSAYIGFFGVLVMIYLYGKLARLTGRIILATLLLLLVTYLLKSRSL